MLSLASCFSNACLMTIYGHNMVQLPLLVIACVVLIQVANMKEVTSIHSLGYNSLHSHYLSLYIITDIYS